MLEVKDLAVKSTDFRCRFATRLALLCSGSLEGRGVTEWLYTGMYYSIYGGLRNQDKLYHPCNECRDTEGLVMHRLG
jgi:hypothetical protein